jgi:hypothetical protein
MVNNQVSCIECARARPAQPAAPQQYPYPPQQVPYQYMPFYPFVYPMAQPLTQEARRDYLLGGIGAIMSGIFIIIAFALSLYYSIFSYYMNNDSINIILMAVIVMLSVSLILTGFAFYGMNRMYRRASAVAGFIVSIILPVIFMIITMVTIYNRSSSYYSLYSITAVGSGVIIGVLFILTGVFIIILRRYFTNIPHATSTGIMLIVGGSFACSIILCFVGIIIAGVAYFLFAAMLLRERMIWSNYGNVNTYMQR